MRIPLCILALTMSAWAANIDTPDTADVPDQAQAAPAPAAAPAAAPAPAAPTPLPTPSITGPLSNLPPAMFDAGPFGHIAVNGFLSGMGLVQNNHNPGDAERQADLTNGQVFIQKTDGWLQFYVQAGAYNIPDLGLPFTNTNYTVTNLFGPLPVAFLKLQTGKNTSILVGELPTLIGAEYTFDFENVNVERGLLWNQENAVNRGIQINQTLGKFTASLSWNDGFHSGRYSWLTGLLSYTNGPHSIAFVGGGNAGHTAYQTFATPVQNNSDIYEVIYTYTKGAWILQPYYQYTSVPTDAKIGVIQGAHTSGEAVLASRAFKKGFSLGGRWEYISSNGTTAANSVNLMYGPGSAGTSLTATPTFQYGGFFFRGDVGWVHLNRFTSGDGFGLAGAKANQTRVVGEIGFVFGDNIVPKKS